MSNASSRSVPATESSGLAEGAWCWLWVLSQLMDHFSCRTGKGPGNLTSSGMASLLLFVRYCTARFSYLAPLVRGIQSLLHI